MKRKRRKSGYEKDRKWLRLREKSKKVHLVPNVKEFSLQQKKSKEIRYNYVLGILRENRCQTQTGGVAFYDVDKIHFQEKHKNNKVDNVSQPLNLNDRFCLYWISEETYKLFYLDIPLLKIAVGQISKSGDKVDAMYKTKLGGLVLYDSLYQEVKIKLGELFQIDKKKICKRSCFWTFGLLDMSRST